MTTLTADPRPVEMVEADKMLIRRHLRRKAGVAWRTDEDGVIGGEVEGTEWKFTLEYLKKQDRYRVCIFWRDPALRIDRHFAVTEAKHYQVIADVMTIWAGLTFVNMLDLKTED